MQIIFVKIDDQQSNRLALRRVGGDGAQYLGCGQHLLLTGRAVDLCIDAAPIHWLLASQGAIEQVLLHICANGCCL